MSGSSLTTPRADAGRAVASWRFRPDVEGLRAVAIAAVVGYHVGLPLFGGGFVGVDVFFVISGFLITGLLVQEVTATERVSLARFWARRARRLLPAATLVLGVVAVVSFVAIPAIDHGTTGLDVVSAAIYVANMRFAVQATDYLASDAAPSPVLHFWSLGVEEQFYVVWPLLIVAVAAIVVRRWARGGSAAPVSRGVLAGVLATLGVISFLVSLRLTDRIEPWAFFGMPARAWEFAVGGLVSLGAVELGRVPDAARRTLGWAGAVVLLGSVALVSQDRPYPGTAALWPVLAAAAVIAAGSASSEPRVTPETDLSRGANRSVSGVTRDGVAPSVGAVLSWWPARALGRLSYSWYLWHWPVLVLVASVVGGLSVPAKLGLALLSLVPAALAYRFVERPLHHAPFLLRSTRRSLGLGAALSATAALLGVALATLPGGGALASGLVVPTGADEQTGRGAAPLASAAPVSAAGAAAAGVATSASPSASPSGTSLLAGGPVVWPSGPLTPGPAYARGDLPILYADGCHLGTSAVTHGTCAFGDTASTTQVVLFGDSHAAQWFPTLEALATQHHWRLLARTKSGCPAPDVTIFNRGLTRAYDECDTWRASVLAEIARIHPALVVAAGTRTDSLVDRSTGSRIDPAKAPAEWIVGWGRTLARLSAAGVHVAVLRDTPWPGRDVPACVGQHRSDPGACDLSRAALDSPAYDVGTAKGVVGATGVDLTSVICDPTSCPVTRGRYLVYRDTSHLTATFARALAPYLGQLLVPLVSP